MTGSSYTRRPRRFEFLSGIVAEGRLPAPVHHAAKEPAARGQQDLSPGPPRSGAMHSRDVETSRASASGSQITARDNGVTENTISGDNTEPLQPPAPDGPAPEYQNVHSDRGPERKADPVQVSDARNHQRQIRPKPAKSGPAVVLDPATGPVPKATGETHDRLSKDADEAPKRALGRAGEPAALTGSGKRSTAQNPGPALADKKGRRSTRTDMTDGREKAENIALKPPSDHPGADRPLRGPVQGEGALTGTSLGKLNSTGQPVSASAQPEQLQTPLGTPVAHAVSEPVGVAAPATRSAPAARPVQAPKVQIDRIDITVLSDPPTRGTQAQTPARAAKGPAIRLASLHYRRRF